MQQMLRLIRVTATLLPLAIAFCCGGCSNRSSGTAINSAYVSTANQATSTFDWVKFYLSDSPPTIKRKDWMQINGGAESAYPNAPLLYLFTALKHNPRITNFRIDWGWAIFSGSTKGVATYNRKTKILWYREANFGGGSPGGYAVYIYKGVTPKMLYQAGTQLDGNAFEKLDEQGCTLVMRRQWKRS